MLKHFIILILISVIVILLAPYLAQALHADVVAYNWISGKLIKVFAGSEIGTWLRKLIALLIIPIIIGLIPALIYWLVKRHWPTFFIGIVWIAWIVHATVWVMHKM